MEPITVITLIISMTACLLTYLVKKVYSNRSNGGMTGAYVYTAIGCIVSAILLMLWGGFDGISLFTCLLGVLFGLAISLGDIFMIKALQSGPMAYTMVITSCSTILTALSGFFFFGESIGILQIVGIALMVGSFIFAAEKKTDDKKGSAIWLLFCILAFTCSGSIGFMQKIHQSSAHKSELNTFLVVSFAISFIFATSMALIFSKKEKKPLFEKDGNGKVIWLFIGIMVLSGICVGTNHKLNLALSGQIPSAVFFPVVNGGNLVLTTLSALILFKEKLTRKQWIGVILGILSVAFLCMPTAWIFSFKL